MLRHWSLILQISWREGPRLKIVWWQLVVAILWMKRKMLRAAWPLLIQGLVFGKGSLHLLLPHLGTKGTLGSQPLRLLLSILRPGLLPIKVLLISIMITVTSILIWHGHIWFRVHDLSRIYFINLIGILFII